MFVRDPRRDRKTYERKWPAPYDLRNRGFNRSEKHRWSNAEARRFARPWSYKIRLSEETENLYHRARKTIPCRKEEEMEEKRKEISLAESVIELASSLSPCKITLRLEEGSEGLVRNGMIVLSLHADDVEIHDAVEVFKTLWRAFDLEVEASRAAFSVEALAERMDKATALATPWPFAQTGGENMVGKTIGDVLEEDESLVWWLSTREPRPGNRMERKAIAAAIRLVQPAFQKATEEEITENEMEQEEELFEF